MTGTFPHFPLQPDRLGSSPAPESLGLQREGEEGKDGRQPVMT